jgi:phosphonopyruvate decarboxylase
LELKLIEADDFLGPARQAGFDFYVGVPCSFLDPFINRTMTHPDLDYVAAASEGEAIAIASGAWLAGRKTVVMFQNSGLGNAINPLTSLNYPFRIPSLLITTWRAGPGLKDEPQHELMGEITPDLLDLVKVARRRFPNSSEDVGTALDEAIETMDSSGLPYAYIMEKGDVASCPPDSTVLSAAKSGHATDFNKNKAKPTRMAAMEQLLHDLPDSAAIIATTGKCGRELFTLSDRPQHLYQVGSMGCASSMSLGVALNVSRPVVALDGDGALLMKMGTLATIGAYAPNNLIHVVLDNGTYDSTGGQMTVSSGVDFAQIALGCGYANVFTCDDLEGFSESLLASLAETGPSLIHMRIKPESMDNLGRPTIKPYEVAQRFRDFLTNNDD